MTMTERNANARRDALSDGVVWLVMSLRAKHE